MPTLKPRPLALSLYMVALCQSVLMVSVSKRMYAVTFALVPPRDQPLQQPEVNAEGS